MKKLSKTFFVIFGACLCLMFVTAESKACVTCEVISGQWFCVAAEGGGGACKISNGGTSCTITGVCLGDGRQSPENCKAGLVAHSLVSIPDSMIREVAAGDARLALALIEVRDIRAGFDVAQINFTSFEYTFYDVENRLTQTPGFFYFEQLELIRSSYARDPNIITYDVSIAGDRADGSANVSVSLAGGGKSIEVELQPAAFGSGKDMPDSFKAVSYRIK